MASKRTLKQALERADRDREEIPRLVQVSPSDYDRIILAEEIDRLLPYNQLDHAQAERLDLLTEEMGEALQIIGKIKRHGLRSRHPNGGPTNKQLLERELGDVLVAINLLTGAKDVSQPALTARVTVKTETVKKYLHYQ